MRITVKNKIATGDGAVLVCGNSDYIAEFVFDDEWGAYPIKTARFIYGDRYRDMVFEGNTCAVPVLRDTTVLRVGVYAGDLHTTTPAYFDCEKSILCPDPVHDEPPEDVYNQLIALIRELPGGGGSSVQTVEELDPDAPVNSYQFVEIKNQKGE